MRIFQRLTARFGHHRPIKVSPPTARQTTNCTTHGVPRIRLSRVMATVSVGLAALVSGGALSAVTSTPAQADPMPAMTGPSWPFNVSPTVVIHNLYMDNNWDADNPTNLSRAVIDDFTNQLLDAGYFDDSGQYGVNQVSFNGSDQAIAACPPPPSSFNYFQLSSWILCEKHNLPSSSTNGVNLWQVYAPINSGIHMQISWPWGGTTQIINTCQSASGMDGFHSQTLPSVFPFDGPQTFGIVFPSCPMSLGFGPTGTMLETTKAASHELIEAATDPQGNSWYDRSLGSNGEAGDLCENGNPPNGFIAGGSYQIASYWSNANNGCVAPGNGSARVNPPSGQTKVPSVLHQTTQQAVSTVRSAGLAPSLAAHLDLNCTQDQGVVIGQNPSGGAIANLGSLVTITVERWPNSCP